MESTNTMRKIAVFALLALASIPAQMGQVAEVKAGSSCPAEWKERIGKYPFYVDERGNHLGILMQDPRFPDACFCDINPLNIIEYGTERKLPELITKWKARCGHTRPDLFN